MPFVVRTVQRSLPRCRANTAGPASLANAVYILRRITLPLVAPAFLTGFALALARTLANMDRSSSSPATCG